jgi:hypothetical protein
MSKEASKKMASKLSTRKRHKLKPSRTAQSKIQRVAKRSAPLNALRDATRKAELQRKRQSNKRKRQSNKCEARPGNGGTPGSPGLDVLGLMNRRVEALLDLPKRIAHCHSPFELWREQARYMQEVFADYQLVAQHMMTNSLQSSPGPRPRNSQDV